MKKRIKCEGCNQEIVYRDEFFAALMIVYLAPFHNECYGRELGKYSAFLFGNLKINGTLWTVHAILCVPLAIGLVTAAPGNIKWVALIVLLPIIYRILTYALYERYLIV